METTIVYWVILQRGFKVEFPQQQGYVPLQTLGICDVQWKGITGSFFFL